MMKNRKTRVALATVSVLAGVAAYMLLTTHVTVTSPLAQAKGAQAVYVGPNGPKQSPSYEFGKAVPNAALATYWVKIDTNRLYAGLPDLIAVDVSSGAPVSVMVPSGVAVRSVAPMETNVIGYPSTGYVTVDTTTFTRESDRIYVANGDGQWSLTAKVPGTYRLTVRVGGKTLIVPLTVVPAPSVAVATRTTYSSPLVGTSLNIPLGAKAPSGAHVNWTMQADLSGQKTTKTVDGIGTAGFLTHLAVNGPVYGTITQTMTQIGLTTAQMNAGYGVSWQQPAQFASIKTVEAVDPVHRNPLWLLLGGALAVLALVLPGRRNRDDEGDGQDGTDA